jgi:hypothetical protein
VRIVVVIIFQAVCWCDFGSIVVLVHGGETSEDGFPLIVLLVVTFCRSTVLECPHLRGLSLRLGHCGMWNALRRR